MVAVLGHRGPDATGIALVGSVGLGHARLSIVDPSPAGSQPMEHPTGRWWLSYNGEVFNHEDLRAELPDHRYRGGSDTETLLHALASWGERAIDRSNGQFAYAALDAAGRRLLLVRDPYGIKPLYLARHGEAILFASEMRALFAAGLPRRPRLDAVAHTFARSWVGGRTTPFEGVSRVLPGTVVSVDLDSLELSERRWHSPTEAVDPERAAALAGLGREQAVDLLEQELRAAVRRRLMADVPVAAMCSGGLDSSLVTAFAREEQPGIRAYTTTVPEQPSVDEGPWAERVARHLGIELRTMPLTPESLCGVLVPAVEHFEYPLVHETALTVALTARAARKDGVKVLLTGESADELFGGYRTLRRREYEELTARGRPLQAGRLWARRLLESRPAAPCAEAADHERETRRAARAAYAHHRGARRRFESALADDLSTVLPHPLNRQDKNAMQDSVETRPPFLDPAVVELALNLPLELRVQPRPKGIVRDLAARHLPRDVAERRKVNPFQFGLAGHLARMARPAFLEQGRLRELLEVPADAWARRIAEAPPYASMQLWTGEIWCRTVLEGRPAAEVESELWLEQPVARTSLALRS
jgi:asparagine synthase (glutamine-hydrolysing)